MAGGRQREFDKREALDAAMRVFWKKGYVGAALSELTDAMGINKPSMYATFGNKEQLFIQATEYYLHNYAQAHIRHLHEQGVPLQQRLKNYLMSVLAVQCAPEQPRGCYISLCVSESAGETIPSKAMSVIEEARDFSEYYLRDFFKNEIALQHIDRKQSPGELALFIVTFLHGTAALTRGGKSLSDLEPVIDRVIASLAID